MQTNLNKHTNKQLHKVLRWSRGRDVTGPYPSLKNPYTLNTISHYRVMGYSSIHIATIMGMELGYINATIAYCPLPQGYDSQSLTDFMDSINR